MRLKSVLAALSMLLCAAVMQAQVKGSGTINCAKPAEEHKVDISPNQLLPGSIELHGGQGQTIYDRRSEKR